MEHRHAEMWNMVWWNIDIDEMWNVVWWNIDMLKCGMCGLVEHRHAEMWNVVWWNIDMLKCGMWSGGT